MIGNVTSHAYSIIVAIESAACGLISAVINVDSSACSTERDDVAERDVGVRVIIAAFALNMMIHVMWARHILSGARRGWAMWAVSLIASIWASRLVPTASDGAFLYHIQCLYIPWTVKMLEYLEW